MTINVIELEHIERKHIEVWNNGNRIHTIAIDPTCNIHEAVAKARAYLHEWAGDDEPAISKALQEALKASDSLLTRMAFGEEYR